MIEKAQLGPWALHKSIPLLIMIVFLTLSVGVLRVAAANQVILDWETDPAGNALLPGQVIDDEFHASEGISLTISGISNRPGGGERSRYLPQ